MTRIAWSWIVGIPSRRTPLFGSVGVALLCRIHDFKGAADRVLTGAESRLDLCGVSRLRGMALLQTRTVNMLEKVIDRRLFVLASLTAGAVLSYVKNGLAQSSNQQGDIATRGTKTMALKREVIRIEPYQTTFDEKFGAPASICTRAGDLIFISGMPPMDEKTGDVLQNAPFEVQAERCLEQMKHALEAAGSDMDHVMKCNVLCAKAEYFKSFNSIYLRYFSKPFPARIFFTVPVWTGPFDLEIDCIAIKKG
jgi:2-iminobutanoate/2-iminopropanoate deaminase